MASRTEYRAILRTQRIALSYAAEASRITRKATNAREWERRDRLREICLRAANRVIAARDACDVAKAERNLRIAALALAILTKRKH